MHKLHLTWTSDASPEMQLQSRLAIEAAKNIGPCTIWVHESEISDIDPHLSRLAEFLPYKSLFKNQQPWISSPKWRIKPRGEVVLGCDADTVIWNRNLVLQYANTCLAAQAICGTIAYADQLTDSEFRQLFADYGLPYEDKHRYQVSLNPAPFCVNHGAVMIPANLLTVFSDVFYEHLPKLVDRYPDRYYTPQIAVCLSIYLSGLNRIEFPYSFNYYHGVGPMISDFNEIAMLHYGTYRDDPFNAQIPQFRSYFRSLLPDAWLATVVSSRRFNQKIAITSVIEKNAEWSPPIMMS